MSERDRAAYEQLCTEEMIRMRQPVRCSGPHPTPVASRRVIQITATGVVENASTQCEFVLHALCDDGSIWWRDNRGSGWVRVSDIPDGEPIA